MSASSGHSARALVDHFTEVVRRDTLVQVAWPSGESSRNALDVHMVRLRRRLLTVGLEVRTVRARGYLLQPHDGWRGRIDGRHRVLLDILIVLVAAKVAVEIAERINVPAVVAEIVAGMIIGPSVLEPRRLGDETLKVLGELGVILLLLGVGMEMDLGELGAVGRAAMSVAVVGVVVPMVGGFAVATALGHDSNQSLFIGAALAATSVGHHRSCVQRPAERSPPSKRAPCSAPRSPTTCSGS